MAPPIKYPVTKRKGVEGKHCKDCEAWKPLADYYEYRSGGKNYRLGRCKVCHLEWISKHHAKNPGLKKEQANRHWHKVGYNKRMEKQYGLTREQFDLLADEQHGVCAICLKQPEKWNIDHDHATGKVRGLLCSPCNLGIGCLGDDEANLRRAADYLQEHRQGGRRDNRKVLKVRR